MALWSGRFQEEPDAFAQRFGAAFPIDGRLYEQDILGSVAHAEMLASQGIISQDDYSQIKDGLLEIRDDIDSGAFEFKVEDEDVHMAIEAELTRRIGDAGARLHTGRSRNDQVATDLRLYAKRLACGLMRENIRLREVLVDQARENMGAIMPGYTHLQHAQPVLFSHHMLAYGNMFARDFKRFSQARDFADENPLGAAALAGTTYPLDRDLTTSTLGFSCPMANSLDAVSDRDFLVDLAYACSMSILHLSRLCEELILWSSSEFGFISLSDSYTTGSSIMPQKRNPDFAELVRGKSGRIVGDLVSLMVTMKSLPLAYNKDLQETKGPAIEAADTLCDCYVCVANMIGTMTVKEDAMLKQAKIGYMAATDLADYLAKKGLPFRRAHEIVGHLVLLCDKRNCDLEDLSMEDLKHESELFEEDVSCCLDLKAIADSRDTLGGTSAKSVSEQLSAISSQIEHDKKAI